MTRRRWVYLVLVLVSAQGLLAATTPVTVSPGQAKAMVPVESRCPMFSWGVVPDAESYELVVYKVGEEGEEAKTVLRERITGTASAWTPPLDQCLKRGSSYAWSVRALAEYGDTEWSPPSLFEVSAGPSGAEVEEALAVLERYRDHQRQQDTGESTEARKTVGDENSVVPSTRVSEQKPGSVILPLSIGDVERVFSGPAERVGGIAAAALIPGPTPSLTVDDQIHLAASSNIFKDGVVFLWDDSEANTGIGHKALANNTSGRQNTASGHSALLYNTTGGGNTASGYRALHNNTEGFRNTASGWSALRLNTTGNFNTASGYLALYRNTDGGFNTASGSRALVSNTTGNLNTASGYKALYKNIDGHKNTASGAQALRKNATGYKNTASGYAALFENTTAGRNSASGYQALRNNEEGFANTAMGYRALYDNSTGDRNTGIGTNAGRDATTGNDNIFIGSGAFGLPSDTNTIRIGGTTGGNSSGQQNRTFINGIFAVLTGVNNAVPVLIDSAGQLGTASSSRRYKEAIESMGAVSERLLALRPVTFRYKRAFERGDMPIQFGLIAEEVAKVFPELVVFDEEGQPETVKYHLLSTMLLNELQKQHRQNLMQWGLMGLMLLAGVTVTLRHARFG